MKTAFCLCAYLCFAVSVWSQTPKPSPGPPELPSGPLLRSAPDFSKWEIVFSYPDEEHKKHKPIHKSKEAPVDANARPKKVVTTKTGRIIHEEQIDVLSRTADTWYNGGTQYTKSTKDSVWYQPDKLTAGVAADVAYHPLPATGYREMDLIKEENYAGVTTYENRKCLVFTPGGFEKLDLSNVNEAKKKLKSIEEIAYVDADSRLPVSVRTPDDLRTFQFDPPPTKVQELPDDLVDQIKNGEDARARLNQPASRPY